jgi:hypothetical protein
MTALKKPEATKCSNHHTISLTACMSKTPVKVFRSRTENKLRV